MRLVLLLLLLLPVLLVLLARLIETISLRLLEANWHRLRLTVFVRRAKLPQRFLDLGAVLNLDVREQGNGRHRKEEWKDGRRRKVVVWVVFDCVGHRKKLSSTLNS